MRNNLCLIIIIYLPLLLPLWARKIDGLPGVSATELLVHYSCSRTRVPFISGQINRIYHRFPMKTEKSQPEGKRIMPETRFTDFRALSVDSRVGISWSASETDD